MPICDPTTLTTENWPEAKPPHLLITGENARIWLFSKHLKLTRADEETAFIDEPRIFSRIDIRQQMAARGTPLDFPLFVFADADDLPAEYARFCQQLAKQTRANIRLVIAYKNPATVPATIRANAQLIES